MIDARALVQRLIAAGVDPVEAAVITTEVVIGAISPAAAPTPSRRDAERVWVYIMAVDHPGAQTVKVGISKHPNYRLLTLEKQQQVNLYLAHSVGPWPRRVAMAVERQAHDMLADTRDHGEWFECGADRAIEVVKYCADGVA